MGSFDHVLSPLKVGNHIFKNRIVMTMTTPQFLQEDEDFPAETQMQHYWQRAKNGASLIAISGLFQFKREEMPPVMRDHFMWDLDKGDHHYMSQMVEGIHAFGTYATTQLGLYVPHDWDISAQDTVINAHFQSYEQNAHVITVDEIKWAIDELVRKCLILKQVGFDGINFHSSYHQSLLGRSLSPATNHRTDAYGGSFEGRIRLMAETCDAIKAACGRDFIIEAQITGEERDEVTGELVPGGWTLEDSKNFAEAMSGRLDILHLRGWEVNGQHPQWFCADEPPFLYIAEKCKEAVTETKILATSGFKNPDVMDAVIASGQADLIGMARGLIADPEFVQKLYDDRADDIVPCLHCNKCLESGPEGTPRTCRCSVNPLWGFESRVPALFPPTRKERKVLVVGGGPAGMEAALVAHDRGHDVELVEKAEKLGGQLNIADASPRKWALRDLRDYLAHQLEKKEIPVKLGHVATADDVAAGGYDVVIAALGAKPKIPPIPGIDGPSVTNVLDVYGNEEALGQRVVIVGGGSSAVETGMHLAEEFGRDVLVLGRNAVLAKDLPPVFLREPEEALWNSIERFDYRTQATVTAITDEGVIYTDAEGAEHVAPADSVVIGIGMEPLADEALALAGAGARLVVIGDNRNPGSIMEAMREGYFAAAQL